MKNGIHVLTASHRAAASRRRRIIAQFDTTLGPVPMRDVARWREKTFLSFDQPGSQVDAICWDCDVANPESNVTPRGARKELVALWQREGIDWPTIFVDETHRRGLQAFWSHRISEVDHGNPIKQKHPDWLIRTWHSEGLWNLAVPEVRDMKTRELRRLVERYAFDGIMLDFARHVPSLPVGRQWELRGETTAFVRQMRDALLAVERATDRPILLGAKVPPGPAACRADGFDVATWVTEGLVDWLTVGSRALEVDLEGFRRELGHGIKLYCGLDDHHSSDAYQFPPIEVFRGVAANWWRQGADGITVFNWYSAPREACDPPPDGGASGYPWYGPRSQEQGYIELGSPDTLRGKDKTFPVERREGYSFAEGEFHRNAHGQLPALLRYDGAPTEIRLYFGDAVGDADRFCVRLGVTLYRAEPGDVLRASLNGHPLEDGHYDYDWKDPQIFSPQPQPNSGWYGYREPDPEQRLLRLTCDVPLERVKPGWNTIGIGVDRQAPHLCRQIQVEKVEMTVRYENRETPA